LKRTRNRVEKYKDVDRDENRHTSFLRLAMRFHPASASMCDYYGDLVGD